MEETHKLYDIRQQLLGGKGPVALINEGFARSSVYYVAKKLRDAQLGMPGIPPGDEVAELRRRREIIKLEKEIADIEAGKEKLPDRVASLEADVKDLRSLVCDAVDTAICHCMMYAGMPNEKAVEYAN
ncbi:hypothetical protein KKE60_08660, partial [Patescibacteria group bacterium]|nr:hypothetical protein [Patescibacteria group bacterium]